MGDKSGQVPLQERDPAKPGRSLKHLKEQRRHERVRRRRHCIATMRPLARIIVNQEVARRYP
ncbi:hypothetical protein SCLCIDRAFT_1210188 [Scleroderma citrinum Foug A]|uniref:Uncharacterized protein n=1 Tax=Scleroderma citrinum Foug A TaxID=1036808 RepID=A0A0C3EGW5_9AGAM|nr:hypothetical protein SCLCIDRAFT_1210188 [Scleroderma citrinum Foug A]